MTKNNLYIFEDEHQQSNTLAAKFVERVKAAEQINRPFSIALSGGNTPRRFLEQVAISSQQISWSHVHFYWVDERCVPPDHADSNHRMTMTALLSKIDIPETNIQRIRGEENPADEAQRYSRLIAQKVLPGKNGWPVFDWVLLGIGEDGHTASLFPGMLDPNAKDICVVATHPQSGWKRISLNMPVINSAKRITFLVSGSGKASIVRQIIEEPAGQYPASHVRPQDGTLEWYLDQSAADDLSA